MQQRFFSLRLIILSALLAFSSSAFAIKAPDFNLPGTKAGKIVGTDITLKRYKGKIIYVDFWASWCVPCKKSFPWMNTMQERYGKQGLKVIAINLDEDREKADEFLLQVPADFVIAYDSSGKTAERYDLKVMPSSFLINRKGELVDIHKGFKPQDREQMENKIRKQLGKK